MAFLRFELVMHLYLHKEFSAVLKSLFLRSETAISDISLGCEKVDVYLFFDCYILIPVKETRKV